MPAYVFPGDPFLTDLLDESKAAPSLVVLNLDNGDGDVSVLDETADALRRRRTPAGEPVRVVGYVWTSRGAQVASRPLPEITAAVDRWLAPRNGSIHYDGIFFDVAPHECGTSTEVALYRDKYRSLREYVDRKLGDRPSLVINNSGTAVPACYLEPGHRTADIFVTFEGSAAAYAATADRPAPDGGYWIGGNVSAGGHYVTGDRLTFPDAQGHPTEVDVDRSSFWHIVHAAPAGEGPSVVDTAAGRYAGWVLATTSPSEGNPYDEVPGDLQAEIRRADELS